MANYALQYDGSNSYTNLGNLGTLGADILTKGFHMRFKFKTTQSNSIGAFGFYDTAKSSIMFHWNNKTYQESLAPGYLSFYFCDGINNLFCGATTNTVNFADGNEHIYELSANLQSKTATLKFDNNVVAITYLRQDSIPSLVNIQHNFYVGGRSFIGNKSQMIAGILDNFQIGTLERDYAFYSFNEGTGTTSADATGNNNTATHVSSPAWVTGLSADSATVLSVTPISITTTSFVARGNLVFDGGETPTSQGIVLGTSANPTTADTILAVTPGTMGAFSVTASGLSNGTTYHYRAYATNSVGTVYGEDMAVMAGASAPTVTDSAATTITRTSFIANGNVTSNGGAPIAERGFVYGTSANPTTSDTKVVLSGTTGAYTTTISGLTANTTYHYRAYAINGVDTSYGSDISVTTNANSAPMMQTLSVANVNPSLAKALANILDYGGVSITEMGIVYGTSANPTTSDTKTIIPLLGVNGNYSVYMKGLTAGTTYHCRAYAINSLGTGYGDDITFTALAATVPTVFSYAALGIGKTQFKGHGYVAINGGQTITERGFVVGTSTNPTTSDTKIVVAGTLGNYYGTVSGLTANTTYHYRAYATNATGTSYGNDITFTTYKATGRQTLHEAPDNLGITVSSETNNSGPTDQVDRDLVTADIAYFKSVGLKHVRLACMMYNKGAILNPNDSYWNGHYLFSRQSANDYIQAGIDVQYIIHYGSPIANTNSDMDAFKQWLADEVVWAIAHGITILQLENECDYKRGANVSQQDMYNWLQSLALLVRSVGFTGEVTYSDYYDGTPIWRTQGLGNFDTIGMDHYGLASFTPPYQTVYNYNRLAKDYWGENVFLSEWSIDNHNYQWDFSASRPSSGVSPTPIWNQHTIKKWVLDYYRNVKIMFPNHVNYYYCWKNRADGPLNALAASDMSGLKRLFWYGLIGQRQPVNF